MGFFSDRWEIDIFGKAFFAICGAGLAAQAAAALLKKEEEWEERQNMAIDAINRSPVLNQFKHDNPSVTWKQVQRKLRIKDGDCMTMSRRRFKKIFKIDRGF